MTLDLDDTIAAIASGPAGGVRGIVRLSGPQSVAIVQQLIRPSADRSLIEICFATCRRETLHLPRALGPVPVTVYLWPTASSYTRQPSAELHLFGSPPLLEAVLEAVCCHGARLARPGEFTLRAFLAGRLDLTQAEAVLGVIDARSRSELDHALDQLAGGLARPLGKLREALLDLLAQLEAGLDFVEEDIEFISAAELARQLAAISQQVAELSRQMQARGEAGDMPRIVLMGRPNAGKSSLLNALAGSDAAIVSELAGTTRDFVTRQVNMGNRDCLLIDTAGLLADAAASEPEVAAQATTLRQAEHADLTLLCLDASQPLSAWEREQLAQGAEGRIAVWTKCDLVLPEESDEAPCAIRTSSMTGNGLDELRSAIRRALDSSLQEAGVVATTADRCRESLCLAADSLSRAHAAAGEGSGEELIASEVRVALDELGRVVGAVYTDDILDRVFSRFCIGK